MFYYLKVFSFDHDRPVTGPFPTGSDCFRSMEADAERTYRQATFSRIGDQRFLDKDESMGTIRFTETFKNDDPDKILWAMFYLNPLCEQKVGGV